MFKYVALAGAMLALSAGAAAADIVIVQGSVPGNPAENVLLNTGATGTTITGTTNQTSSLVTFVGLENLSEPSNGQARIEAQTGGFTSLEYFLTAPTQSFLSTEFNINSAVNGTVTIAVLDNQGQTTTGTFNVGAGGQNFFNINAINNQTIKDVRITTSGDMQDVRQIRLGGVAGAVPEPASWALMILGFGMVGAGMRVRRRRTATGLA